MTKHYNRGTRSTLWVDDGFGNLTRINFDQLITRLVSGWDEL
jgi:hypothetical protein